MYYIHIMSDRDGDLEQLGAWSTYSGNVKPYILGYARGKHLDSLTPKKGSTQAKNELRKRKKLIEACFDTVLQV